MSEALYVKRDTAPSLLANEQVEVFSRGKGLEGAPPRFFVVSLVPGSTFDWQTLQGIVPDPTGYTSGPGTMARGQRAAVELTTAPAGDHNVYILRCLTGRIAVTFVSPHDARMQFRRWERRTA